MKSRFRQIGIKDEYKHKTTFIVLHGHYKWNVMPFELKNAPSEFQYRMDEEYKRISKFYLVYIDYAQIFNNSEEEHAQHLSRFKELTYKHAFTLSESKMKIGLDEIEFLGHHIKNFFGTSHQDRHIIPQPHIAEKYPSFHISCQVKSRSSVF